MQLTVLVDDSRNSAKPEITAKHGLSLFIKLKVGRRIVNLLMDTGPSADIVLKNAQKLGIDLRKVDFIVLSHGHYDHTGGLLGVLKYIDKKVPVILHPEALELKFVVKKRLKKVGVPFPISELGGSRCVLSLNRWPSSIMPGVWVSGEIKRISPFEKVKGFKVRYGGKLLRDNLLDDQALFVKVKGKGLVVVSGCAHAGLINTIKQARRITGSDGLYAVVGGFHLAGASARRIKETIRELQRADVKFLIPCHCTGKEAISKFVTVFEGRCRRLRTGDKIAF